MADISLLPRPTVSHRARSAALIRTASWPHYLLLVAVSLFASILYIHEPGFGDELTYWSLAFDLHDIGRAGWSVGSFHDLRWPVWFLSWLWQGLFGPGLLSFYVGPAIYLAAGAALAFTFGRLLLRSFTGAWLCAVIYLLAPMLDTVLYRPVPDLSENVWGGLAVLGWWVMMNASSPRRAWLAGIASGLAIGISYSNRVSGLFVAPILTLATILFFPRRWKWLLLPAVVSALVFLSECAVYQWVCGDWLHSLHANLGGTAAKDVEITPLWKLLFRYVNLLFHGNRLAPVYTVLAGLGTWAGWRKYGVRGRVIVVWFYALFLEYSCAIQSVHPVLPLIGSTARYVAAFALPASLLTALGAKQLWDLVRWKLPRLEARILRRPALASLALVAFTVLYSVRPFFDLGFTKDLRRYMETVPPGTKIFSHHAMRDLAFLADAAAAKRLNWTAPRHILVRTPELEQAASSCDEFWVLRKQVWLTERKRVEHNHELTQPPLASYLECPEEDWTLRKILAKGDATDITLFTRRREGAPPPHILMAGAPELGAMLPGLPLEWSAKRDPQLVWVKWAIPASMRGKSLSVVIEGSSTSVEPLIVRFAFVSNRRHGPEMVYKPIFYQNGGKDFFALSVPKDADRCDIQLKFNKSANEVKLTSLRAVYDDEP